MDEHAASGARWRETKKSYTIYGSMILHYFYLWAFVSWYCNPKSVKGEKGIDPSITSRLLFGNILKNGSACFDQV